jgi:hypothetical protein
MKRHHLILAILLVVQIALSAFVFWPRAAATGGGEPLFADLETGDIVALTITDDQGNSVALRKDVGAWGLPDADDYPADESRITPVLEKIVALNTRRLVTRTDTSHKRLQVAVDDFVRRIGFETSDGTAHIIYLGSAPSYGATHFRLDGRNETYLADDLSTWEVNATAASWVDTTYFSVDQEELTQVTLENANGTFVFTRDDGGNWTLEGLEEGEELASGKVSTAINRATLVTLVSPLGQDGDPAYGLDDPVATVTLESDDQTIALRVGAQDPDDSSYVVKVSESPYYVRVAGYNVQPLVENARDDFIQPPPTPAPEAEPTPEGESSTS